MSAATPEVRVAKKKFSSKLTIDRWLTRQKGPRVIPPIGAVEFGFEIA